VASDVTPVVKTQLKSVASAFPAASFADVVTVAVYCVFGVKGGEGRSIAELELVSTTPATVPPAVLNVNEASFTVAAVMDSENMTDMAEFNETPLSPFDGEVSDTVGRIVSGAPSAKPGTNDSALPESPPLPQPDRLPHASTAAKAIPARRLDPSFSFSPFNIREVPI